MGGAVPLLLEPRNREELVAAIGWLRDADRPFHLLGGGANVIVDDTGLDRAVVLTNGCAHMMREEEDVRVLRLGAGLPIPTLVNRTREMGLTGAECLVGIPGTMGGATAMNAGGRHGWLSSICRRVRVLLPSGAEEDVEVDDETFGYRSSIFGEERVVLETVIELEPGNRQEIQERIRTILKEKSAAQPLVEKSSGCIFKNPEGGSAGRLLEECGVKGLKVGGAVVSEKHANFIVNRGGATLRDLLRLIEQVEEIVAERSGVRLEREVRIWRREG